MAEEHGPNLTSDGSCVSIAVRLKQLTASVSACPFQIWHASFRTDDLHPPDNERPPFGMEWRKGQMSQLRDGNSSSGKSWTRRLSPCCNSGKVPVLLRRTGKNEDRMRFQRSSILNHNMAETARVWSTPSFIVESSPHSSTYHLLSVDSTETLVFAFVLSRLNYSTHFFEDVLITFSRNYRTQLQDSCLNQSMFYWCTFTAMWY